MSKNKYTKSGARNSSSDKQRIKAIRDHAQNIHALTMELQPDEVASPAAVPALPTHDGAPMKATPEQIQQLQNGEIPGGFVGDCAICGPGDVQAAWDYCCQQDNADELKQQCVDICCECGWEDALPEDAAPYMEDDGEDSGEVEININVNKSAKGDGVKVSEPASINLYGIVRAVKSDDGEWLLDVLGVPFGGHNNGRDSDGEYFSQQTKLHLDKFPTPPIAYYHGFDENGRPQGEPQYIGKTISTQTKPDGVWFRVALDKANNYAKRIWEAAKQGIARASSGSISHMVRKESNGHITHWPVVELSLIDAVGKRQPANQYAVALPVMKAVYARAGLTLPADDIESIPQDEPKATAKEASGMAQVTNAAKSNGATTTNDNRQLNTGVNMDPQDLAKLVADQVAAALKAKEDADAAKKKQEDELKAQIDAALKAQEEKHAAEMAALKQEQAQGRRLPNGNFGEAPMQRQFANLDKYDNLEVEDLAVAFGLLEAGKSVRSNWGGASEDLRRALAIRIMEDKDQDNKLVAAKSAIRQAGFGAMKANEVNQSTLSGYGSDWVGTTYSTLLWEKIRLATMVAAKIPAIQVPEGSSSIVIPVETTSPTFYVVAQAASQSANPGRVNPTYTTSREATTSQTLTVKKLGAAVNYSGELEEDSIIQWVPTIRAVLTKEGAEVLESCIIDGDTDTSATTNINHIAGTPGGTEYYCLFNGFRKLALITNTANKRDVGAALQASDYLETVKLLGLGGRYSSDRNAVGIITDMWTNWKTLTLPEVKTRDVFVNPTVEGGLVRNLFGYEVIPSANMHRVNQDATYGLKANTAGKIDQGTASNNTTGSILAVRWDQWKLGYKRMMTFEVQRDAISDTTALVLGMRAGLVYRDTEAASISYDITGV